MRVAVQTLTVSAWIVFFPTAALAQAVIAGTVTDPSGAVLPGVTVEAASPALIEKVRSAVTDGSGQYRIENLRPGVYSIRFVLEGFSTVLREGVELSGTMLSSGRANRDGRLLVEGISIAVPQAGGTNYLTDTRNAQEIAFTIAGS